MRKIRISRNPDAVRFVSTSSPPLHCIQPASADSTDGVNWTKPILNLCDIGGSTSNSVVIRSLVSPSVLFDRFEKDPNRRYKIVGCHYHKPGNPKTGYYTMTSPDGLHWSNERQIVQGWWDTCTMSQNPYTGEYLVYHKHEIIDNGRWRLHTFVGGTGEFLVDNDYLIHASPKDIHYHQRGNSIQWSAAGGLGVEFRLTPAVGLYVDPSIRYYFCAGNQPRSIRTIQPLRMEVEAGVRFSFGAQ